MTKEILAPETVCETIKRYWYSQAVKVGNTIYISGQGAIDKEGKVVGKGDFAAQTRQALENIKLILEAAGASMSDIVDMTVFIKDMRYFYRRKEYGDIFREYFGDRFPCVTAIQVVSLFYSDMLIEIKATAVME